jgi:hypothetical protein
MDCRSRGGLGQHAPSLPKSSRLGILPNGTPLSTSHCWPIASREGLCLFSIRPRSYSASNKARVSDAPSNEQATVHPLRQAPRIVHQVRKRQVQAVVQMRAASAWSEGNDDIIAGCCINLKPNDALRAKWTFPQDGHRLLQRLNVGFGFCHGGTSVSFMPVGVNLRMEPYLGYPDFPDENGKATPHQAP